MVLSEKYICLSYMLNKMQKLREMTTKVSSGPSYSILPESQCSTQPDSSNLHQIWSGSLGASSSENLDVTYVLLAK